MKKSPTSNISENQKRLITLSFSRSCQRLESQQQIANATDQRALVFSTLSVAAAALVFGALRKSECAEIAIGAALFFCIAALCAAISAVPQKIYTAGSNASELEDSIQNDIDEFKVLRGLCERNDEYIGKNEQYAKFRAGLYRMGIWYFSIGILIAAFGLIVFEPIERSTGGVQ